MKINPYIQVQQLYGTKKVAKTQKTNAATRTDGVEISSFGREIQLAKQAVANSADVRPELTEPIKTAMKNGTYEVSGESFAEKLWSIAEGR